MAGFNLAIVFGALQWDRIEISAVNATLGVWLLVARETFEKDLAKMAQEAAEAKVALPGPPPHPSV